MTHVLFAGGFRRKWDGKTFFADGTGMNRFVVVTTTTPMGGDGGRNRRLLQEKHKFDYGIKESKIHRGTKSVQLQYYRYQSSPISLWYTMTDEIRPVPNHPNVFIGMGCMAWSGGMLNAAPFCLWRSTTASTDYDDDNDERKKKGKLL
jgi:hypothetical protein